jgi:hypothetical protein
MNCRRSQLGLPYCAVSSEGSVMGANIGKEREEVDK